MGWMSRVNSGAPCARRSERPQSEITVSRNTMQRPLGSPFEGILDRLARGRDLDAQFDLIARDLSRVVQRHLIALEIRFDAEGNIVPIYLPVGDHRFPDHLALGLASQFGPFHLK